MTEMLQGISPFPVLRILKLPGSLVIAPPPPIALIRMGEASSSSLGGRTTGATQSPSTLQSFCTVTAAKRGIGAVAEAVVTEDTGARAMVSCAIAGAVTRGRAMNVGNCADSSTFGLAAA